MDFMNIPRQQQQRLHILAEKAINALQDQASQQLSIKLDALQAFKVLVTYFKNSPEIPKHQLIKAFLQVFYGGSNRNVEALSSTILSNNFAGRVLRYQDRLQMEQYLVKCLYMIYQHSQQQSAKTKTIVEMLFNERYQQIVLDYANMRYQRQRGFSIKIRQYLIRNFIIQQQIKLRQMSEEWKFDKNYIDRLYQRLKGKGNLTTREKAILKSYEEYIINNKNIYLKYYCYQFIQYLTLISDDQFTQEFNVDNDERIQELVRFINKEYVNNLDELKIRANIMKHLEQSRIILNFSETFKLEDIPDDIIVNMLDNVENRIQYIEANYQFIILRRIHDNHIIKREITKDNKKQIEQLLQQCNDGSMYDVVIQSKYKFESIGKIRMRYLHYNKWGDNITINLNHPEYLISFSSMHVKIYNINQCVNLRNLDIQSIHYYKQDIETLHNLKMVNIEYCKYENEQNCLLHDLMENNKLECVYINNYGSDDNTISSMTMSKNISKLRYCDVYQEEAKYDITLDISMEYPEHMRVYDVQTYKDRKYKYGTLKGPEDKVSQLKQSLIHDLKANQ